MKADLEAPAPGGSRTPSVCAQHGRAYEFYDQHCKTIICSNCLVLSDEHRGHRCVTLDVAAAESRASLAAELRAASDGVDGARAALDAFCQSEEKRVHEVFEEVRAHASEIECFTAHVCKRFVFDLYLLLL